MLDLSNEVMALKHRLRSVMKPGDSIWDIPNNDEIFKPFVIISTDINENISFKLEIDLGTNKPFAIKGKTFDDQGEIELRFG